MKDFLLFNTTLKDNKEFFGRMIVDSKIDISGPMSLPVVNAEIKMKKGSNFTFAVPEEKLTTDYTFQKHVCLYRIFFQKESDISKCIHFNSFMGMI